MFAKFTCGYGRCALEIVGTGDSVQARRFEESEVHGDEFEPCFWDSRVVGASDEVSTTTMRVSFMKLLACLTRISNQRIPRRPSF